MIGSYSNNTCNTPPRLPINFSKTPAYPDTPRPVLQNSPNLSILLSFSPTSPCKPSDESVLPDAYTTHRQNMTKIKVSRAAYYTLLKKFGFREKYTFSEYFLKNFPSFSFPKSDRNLVLGLSDQLNKFTESARQSRKTFNELILTYRTYEGGIKKIYSSGAPNLSRDERLEILKRVEETERSLSSIMSGAKIKNEKLTTQFKKFIYAMTLHFSNSYVNDENTAFEIYSERMKKYSVGRQLRPLDFAGLDEDYKLLINSAREAKGSKWLNTILKTFHDVHNLSLLESPSCEGETNLSVQAVSKWILKVDADLNSYPEHVQKAVLGIKERVGCWNQENSILERNSGKALEVYLRSYHDVETTIPYPFKKVYLTAEMRDFFKTIDNQFFLLDWMNKVDQYFSPKAGWKAGSDINMKKIALLIYSLELTVLEKDIADRAKQLAKSIVHYMYSTELTIAMQQ